MCKVGAVIGVVSHLRCKAKRRNIATHVVKVTGKRYLNYLCKETHIYISGKEQQNITIMVVNTLEDAQSRDNYAKIQ
jgi:hypothetical protein